MYNAPARCIMLPAAVYKTLLLLVLGLVAVTSSLVWTMLHRLLSFLLMPARVPIMLRITVLLRSNHTMHPGTQYGTQTEREGDRAVLSTTSDGNIIRLSVHGQCNWFTVRPARESTLNTEIFVLRTPRPVCPCVANIHPTSQ